MNIVRVVRTAWVNLPRIFALYRDARVPRALKIGGVAAALLVISPLDLLGDIPVLGLFDDLALLALLANLFVMLASRTIAADDRAREPRRVGPLAVGPGR